MTEQSTLIKPSTIRFERLLPGPVERVWAYLTESKKRATWLAAASRSAHRRQDRTAFRQSIAHGRGRAGRRDGAGKHSATARSRGSSLCACWRIPGAGTAENRR